MLNTGAFEDHEKIELTLFAKDKAGNESLIKEIVLEVDKSAKPITPSVSITSPAKGDRITVPSTKVDYTADYLPGTVESKAGPYNSGENDPADTDKEQPTGQQGQKAALYYIDSVFAKEKDDETSFDFDAITYPEGSSHTLTVISEDTNGQLHYSGGLGAAMLFADAFDNEDFTADKTNIDYAPSEAKLTDPSQDGEIVSVLSGIAKEIMTLRLKATEETPDGTSIEYFYSIDGWHTWEPITTQTDIVFKIPTKSVAVKAVLHGNGSQSPVLCAWQLEGVIEMSPVRVFSDLLREAKPFHITEPETVTLPVEISTDLSRTDCVNQWLYEDGSLHTESFTYEAYKAQERSKHGLSAFAETKDGFIYASGMANTQLLLRENFAIGFEPPVSGIDSGNGDDSIDSGAGTGEGKPDTDDAKPMPVPQGMVISGKITAPSPVNVIRLDALAYETNAGSIVYEYSFDNKSWDSIDLNDNVALPKAAKEIYLRAKVPDGARLVSWHLEGASGTEKKAEVKLVQPPVNVVASDYGEYYEKDEQKNHILTWENSNGKTGAVECAVFFDILIFIRMGR